MPAAWDPREWEKKLMRMILMQESGITQIFNEFITATSPHLARYKPTGKADLWLRNKAIEASIQKNMEVLHQQLHSYLTVQIQKAWHLAADKTDLLVQDYISKMAISDVVREGFFSRNLDALEAFRGRRVGNMNLSDRVWRICDQTKENLEYYLQSGVGTGRSAAEMSRDVRSLLQDPNKRFRRIRDPETGKLKPSRPMKEYHPGQGVYRSSYQNALRMTRTETNMAYRMSDQARWQKLDFITGYEVKLSASHPVEDICDFMVGEYPKSFVFASWHPNCYCYTVPIMMQQDQFVDYLETEKVPKGIGVKNIPAGARQYVKSHSGQFQRWSNTPYWLKDNFKLVNGEFVPHPGIGTLYPGVALTARQATPNVSEAFNYIDSRVKTQVDHAMRMINQVHGDGRLPRIPILAMGDRRMAGLYGTVPTLEGKNKAVKIAISYNGQWKDLTVVHEVGHFLDHCGIGASDGFDSLKQGLLRKFKIAAAESKAVKSLKKTLQEGANKLKSQEIEKLTYLLEDQEIFARAYAQYITAKSADPKLLRQLEKRMRFSKYAEQWESDDFVPLMEEIENVFKELGWLR